MARVVLKDIREVIAGIAELPYFELLIQSVIVQLSQESADPMQISSAGLERLTKVKKIDR